MGQSQSQCLLTVDSYSYQRGSFLKLTPMVRYAYRTIGVNLGIHVL